MPGTVTSLIYELSGPLADLSGLSVFIGGFFFLRWWHAPIAAFSMALLAGVLQAKWRHFIESSVMCVLSNVIASVVAVAWFVIVKR